MSISHSISTDSTSSSNTMPTSQMNEQQMDPSNILYNDHQNYQIIFTNDSRFFDTSLHLFKSYRKLGYIQSDNRKPKKPSFATSTNTLKPQPNGHNHRSRSKPAGFSSNHDIEGNNNDTLKPPALSRDHDHSASQRSNPNSFKFTAPKIKRDTSHVVVSQQRQWTPANYSGSNDDSSDDPDIIVTRL